MQFRYSDKDKRDKEQLAVEAMQYVEHPNATLRPRNVFSVLYWSYLESHHVHRYEKPFVLDLRKCRQLAFRLFMKG